MTPDEITKRCAQFITDSTTPEQLYREAMAAGLEMVKREVESYPNLYCSVRARNPEKPLVEWIKAEAQRVKEGGMTNEQIKERCAQFIDDEEIDCIADMPGDARTPTLRENLESLCREMMAAGLEMAASSMQAMLDMPGSTDDQAWAQVDRVLLERVDWCRQEAQRVKAAK